MRCGIHLFGLGSPVDGSGRLTVGAEHGRFGEATPRPNPWPHS